MSVCGVADTVPRAHAPRAKTFDGIQRACSWHFLPALSESLHSLEIEGLGGFQASSGSHPKMVCLLPATAF